MNDPLPDPQSRSQPPPSALKVVGHRRREPGTPAENCERGAALYRAALELSPWPRPRGFVYKARTWEEYAAWRKAQTNPWLW